MNQTCFSNILSSKLGARSTMAPSSLRTCICFLLLFLLDYIDKFIYDLHLSETLFGYKILLVFKQWILFYCN
jgi:hypothetical protein